MSFISLARLFSTSSSDGSDRMSNRAACTFENEKQAYLRVPDGEVGGE